MWVAMGAGGSQKEYAAGRRHSRDQGEAVWMV